MLAPLAARHSANGMVASIDHLASGAGVDLLRRGGTAADAAVAASAVLAVTSQHLCGMGGDLWAVVHPGRGAPIALNASGRAGSGADADRLRRAGHTVMPRGADPSVVTIPGCVDGWLWLHGRFGRLPLEDVLAPAIGYADKGFPASPGLAAAVPPVDHRPDAADYRRPGGLATGHLVRRPGLARALRAVAAEGRDGFYGGEFGEGLRAVCGSTITEDDLAVSQADWVPAVHSDAWGHRIWTAPPNSQGYLTAAAAWIADGLELPDAADPAWAHLLVEAARQAGHDRLAVLHERADPQALLDLGRLRPRQGAIDPERAGTDAVPPAGGDTIGLCAVDASGAGVSLIQSNASGWGSGLIVPGLRIFLHNRGRGFSLEPGHPAEYAPGRRPPHTLCPTLVTTSDGRLASVLATMGGDSQPQILLQLLARTLHGGEDPAAAVAAGRWSLCAPLGDDGRPGGDGFETWAARGRVAVRVEGHAPPGWADGLRRLGHQVVDEPAWSSSFGHAHAVVAGAEGVWSGGSDPRAAAGGVAGW